LELSNFKCGHDAPIYTVIEEIVQKSGTPYFCFKDIDENKPAGSIKIRVETICYFLKRYREDLIAEKQKRAELERRLKEYEERLRQDCGQQGSETDGEVNWNVPLVPPASSVVAEGAGAWSGD
jgi:hypothetical protein